VLASITPILIINLRLGDNLGDRLFEQVRAKTRDSCCITYQPVVHGLGRTLGVSHVECQYLLFEPRTARRKGGGGLGLELAGLGTGTGIC
jgi:hypothetical protein